MYKVHITYVFKFDRLKTRKEKKVKYAEFFPV